MSASASNNPSGCCSTASRSRRVVAAVVVLALLATVWWVLRRLGRTRLLGSVDDVLVLLELAALFFGIALASAWGVGGSGRRMVGRAALVAVPPLLVLALLELPVLVGDHDWRITVPRPGDDLFLRLKRTRNPWNRDDAELIYTRPPGGRVTGTTYGDCVVWLGARPDRDYPYDLRYDARGYRNERAFERADVAVVGDSFVEAALLPVGELFTTQLEKRLDVTVANLGVGGYGPQQELIVLRRHALPLEPRLVYWLFFEGNDLADAARFEQDRREMAATIELKAGHVVRSLTASLVGLAGCLVAPRARQDDARARQQSGTLTSEGADHGKRLYFPYPAQPLAPADLAALTLVEGLLRDAEQSTKDAGAQLVLVFVPEKFRIYGDQCAYAADATASHWQCSDLPARMAAFAKTVGIDYFDLTPALQEQARRGPLLYFVDDGHWNGAGHELVARELAVHAASRLAALPGR